jgi:hypothetical protein
MNALPHNWLSPEMLLLLVLLLLLLLVQATLVDQVLDPKRELRMHLAVPAVVHFYIWLLAGGGVSAVISSNGEQYQQLSMLAH